MAATNPSHRADAQLRHDLAESARDAREAVADVVHDVHDAVDGAVDRVERRIAEIKPRLRGWLHLATAPGALAVGSTLTALAPSDRARIAALVFTITSVALFATSALFHTGRWSPRVHDTLRRLDHANIFLVIAGTYTPFGLLLLAEHKGVILLAMAWVGAIAGVLFRTLWLSAPRWLYVPVYLVMGWMSVFFVADMYLAGGALVMGLLLAGGLLYTAGAVVYAVQRPNPWPRWFGFHEVFHVCTVLAFAAHCWAVALVVLR